MAAVAAEAAATAASPGDGGAGEAEPELEPIPGSEAGTPLPVTATEAAVPDGEADGRQSAPQADEQPLPPPPPPPPPGELAGSSEAEEAKPPEPAAVPVPPPEQPPAAPEQPEDAPRPPPAPALVPPAGGDSAVSHLIPGSEVRVTLDHIIEDALVVSFRLGEKLFSGVLMDLSKRKRDTLMCMLLNQTEEEASDCENLNFKSAKERCKKAYTNIFDIRCAEEQAQGFVHARFGPHGIPVTVFPKRECKDKPDAMQLQSNTFQEGIEVKREVNGAIPDALSPVPPPDCLWTSKPPPLFHEGAPYPPPLFIRDTYNQSIPQPPPRKIKRPKRKMYREEPTSIMNAIKLRPRQVLCDKCKNSVVAEKKEIRKGSSDSSRYEDKKRRNDSVATVNKKLKTDHKVDGKNQNESQRRNAVVRVSSIPHSRGRVVKVSAQANTSKAQLNTKKVLQSKNMDHAKAREVLKIAKEKAQKKQSETSTSKNAHSKVHFTRRYQNPSSGSLPPRVRLKPQRYRNEENDSSLKTGLEKIRSGKLAPKPQSRCTSTRSAGEAPSETQSPSEGPEESPSEVQDTSKVHVPGEQEELRTLGKKGSKSSISVYLTINQEKSDSSSASVCSIDSMDDLKSSNSECSSSESCVFPPGCMHAPSASSTSTSSSSKEEEGLSNSLKMKIFSKNVSKCITPDGRTICVGDIVWAKIYGFPWWPARILTITVSRRDNGLLARQEARISWFASPTTSFLALSQLSPFLENFQLRFNKKRKGLYRRAITEAAKAAKQLTPEVRALLTQFET